jgi:hypothetical protein
MMEEAAEGEEVRESKIKVLSIGLEGVSRKD